MPLELDGVRVGARGQERGFAVREQRAGRMLGVEVLEPALCEVVAELGVGRASNPQRVPRAEDVVPESRCGQLGRLDRAAELVLRLNHADALAPTGEQCGRRE